MFADLFNSLWVMGEKLLEYAGSLINWLNEPLRLGFDIPVIGFLGINLGSPLSLIATGLIGLIIFWLIKGLVPLL